MCVPSSVCAYLSLFLGWLQLRHQLLKLQVCVAVGGKLSLQLVNLTLQNLKFLHMKLGNLRGGFLLRGLKFLNQGLPLSDSLLLENRRSERQRILSACDSYVKVK